MRRVLFSLTGVNRSLAAYTHTQTPLIDSDRSTYNIDDTHRTGREPSLAKPRNLATTWSLTAKTDTW